MTISLDELADLAKAASVPDGDRIAFIAACDPATILKLLAVVKAAKAAEHALPHKVRNDTSYPISFQEKADASMVVLREALAALDTP